jgi:ABC-type glycerol-3-phosphate transport system substrate-binding protein
MKSTNVLVGATVLVTATALTACGGGSSSSSSITIPSSATASAESLDTAGVLAQAQHTSEISVPYQVNDGALTLTDTSETSEPISVNVTPTP